MVYGVVRNNDDALRIQKMGAISIISDVTKDAIVADIQKEITQKLSLVINNAGFVGVGEKLVNTNPDDFLKQLDVHCLGPLRVCQASVPLLHPGGLMLNISSRFGSISRRASGEFDDIDCSYSYSVAKAAQNMLTVRISREYAEAGIRACAIHPGRLKTSMASEDVDKTPEEAAEKIFELYETAESGSFYSLFEGESTW